MPLPAVYCPRRGGDAFVYTKLINIQTNNSKSQKVLTISAAQRDNDYLAWIKLSWQSDDEFHQCKLLYHWFFRMLFIHAHSNRIGILFQNLCTRKWITCIMTRLCTHPSQNDRKLFIPVNLVKYNTIICLGKIMTDIVHIPRMLKWQKCLNATALQPTINMYHMILYVRLFIFHSWSICLISIGQLTEWLRVV